MFLSLLKSYLIPFSHPPSPSLFIYLRSVVEVAVAAISPMLVAQLKNAAPALMGALRRLVAPALLDAMLTPHVVSLI